MSDNNHASQFPEEENPEIVSGKLRRTDLADIVNNNKRGKVISPKVARKAKASQALHWFTHERLIPIWGIISSKKTWKDIPRVIDFVVDTFNKYTTAGVSSWVQAKANKTNAEADNIRADAELKKAQAQYIKSKTKRKKRKSLSYYQKQVNNFPKVMRAKLKWSIAK